MLTSEAGGIVAAWRGSCRSLVDGDAGRLDPGDADRAFRRSGAALLCLENTHTRAGGTVTDVERTESLAAAAALRRACPPRRRAPAERGGRARRPARRAGGAGRHGRAEPEQGPLRARSVHCSRATPRRSRRARLHARRLGGGTIHKLGICGGSRPRRARPRRPPRRGSPPRARPCDRARPPAARDEHRADEPPRRRRLRPARARRALTMSPDGVYVRLVTHAGLNDAPRRPRRRDDPPCGGVELVTRLQSGDFADHEPPAARPQVGAAAIIEGRRRWALLPSLLATYIMGSERAGFCGSRMRMNTKCLPSGESSPGVSSWRPVVN